MSLILMLRNQYSVQIHMNACWSAPAHTRKQGHTRTHTLIFPGNRSGHSIFSSQCFELLQRVSPCFVWLWGKFNIRKKKCTVWAAGDFLFRPTTCRRQCVLLCLMDMCVCVYSKCVMCIDDVTQRYLFFSLLCVLLSGRLEDFLEIDGHAGIWLAVSHQGELAPWTSTSTLFMRPSPAPVVAAAGRRARCDYMSSLLFQVLTGRFGVRFPRSMLVMIM